MIRRYILTGIAAAFISLSVARSDSPPTAVFEPPDFTGADLNKDEQVSRDEQRRIIIDRFDARDLNGDGQLTPGELPAALFSTADQDQDKKVSSKEFVRFRFGIFERFDDDGNDALNHDEYRHWLESQ